jgi:hypothetical protein
LRVPITVPYSGQNSPTPEERLATIDTVIGAQAETIREQCEIHLEYAGDNYVSMTRVLQEVIDEGYAVTPEIIARLSPYKTEHVNRFGNYELRFNQIPPPVTEELRLVPTRLVKTRHVI